MHRNAHLQKKLHCTLFIYILLWYGSKNFKTNPNQTQLDTLTQNEFTPRLYKNSKKPKSNLKSKLKTIIIKERFTP